MSLEIVLMGLLIVSTLTGLVTEAVKKLLAEYGVKYYANTLAGIVAVVVAVAVSAAYVILTDTAVTSAVIVCVIAIVFLSWLCAMVGYDKVVQTISQFKPYKKEE